MKRKKKSAIHGFGALLYSKGDEKYIKKCFLFPEASEIESE